MLDNALENSHTTSSCVFAFCIITSFNYQKLSNKSISITVTLITIQNIHWAHIFTDQYSPIASLGFDVFIYAFTNLALYFQEGKIGYCIYISKFFKALLQKRHCYFCNTSTMTQKETCTHTNIHPLFKA
jgi:hypothetical protein